MAQEIERKFLVRGAFKPFAREAQRIAQGYLSTEAGRSVRVRIKGEMGYLTIKGASDPTGVPPSWNVCSALTKKTWRNKST